MAELNAPEAYRAPRASYPLPARRPRRGIRGQSYRVAVALMLTVLLLPLLGTSSASAQDEAPPIVPVDESWPAVGDYADDQATEEWVPVEDWTPPRTVYIPETGHLLDGVFLDVWRGWGGALAFGYPITPEFEEDGRIVQYFGYGRFEYWPDDPTGNVVKFGALGSELRPPMLPRARPGDSGIAAEAALAVRAWLPLTPSTVEPDGAEWRFIPETGHGVAGQIKVYWEAIGGADYIGNPVTEQFVRDGITFQIFERGKVALEAGSTPYLVPVGELMAARYALDTTPVFQGEIPAYSEDLFVRPRRRVEEPASPPAGAVPDPNAERWIQVSIGQQYLIAWQGDVPVFESYVSTGRPEFDTPLGSYTVLSKLESQTMEGVIGGEYYNVADVPDVMYFTDRGHAIHGTYWHANFGAPMSHGCVNLPLDLADQIYAWTPIGARVEIIP